MKCLILQAVGTSLYEGPINNENNIKPTLNFELLSIFKQFGLETTFSPTQESGV